MNSTAIICGSDLTVYPDLGLTEIVKTSSNYGELSSPVYRSVSAREPLYFIARHGRDTSVPPHLINYRANIDALSKLGVKQIIALNTVGGLADDFAPGRWALPEQIIDYTFGREQTFFNGVDEPMQHIDFSFPFDDSLRESLIDYLASSGLKTTNYGTYAVTQGPRLETAAEVKRLQKDGAHMVGMTMMPEAALARERGMGYCGLCFVANWGAGMEQKPLNIDEIYTLVKKGFDDIAGLLAQFLRCN